MKPSEILRKATREELKDFKGGAREFERIHGLEKWALRGFTDPSREQVPSVDRAAEIAKAIGLNLFIGNTPPTHPSESETSHPHIGPAVARNFRTGISPSGQIGVQVEIGNLGTAEFSLSAEQAKDLGYRLIHKAVTIEELDTPHDLPMNAEKAG